MKFSQEQIQSLALPSVIKLGHLLYKKEAIVDVQIINDDIIGGCVYLDEEFSPVVSNNIKQEQISFACSCQYTQGGSCEHVVALMYATNDVQDKGQQTDLFAVVDDGNGYETLEEELETEIEAEETEPEIIETRSGKPIGRLYLSEYDELLIIEPRFAYETGFEQKPYFEFNRNDVSTYKLVPVGNNVVYRIVRSKARENSLIQILNEFSLKTYQRGTFTPIIESREWVSDELPLLAQKGFEIFGHKTLLNAQTRLGMPGISIQISAKEEPYSCSINVDFEGIPASLAALIFAVRSNSAYVKLTDGSSGELPESLLNTLKRVLSLVSVDTKKELVFFQKHHIPAISLLSDMSDTCKMDEEFKWQYDKLHGFTKIEKRGQPEAFIGQMRDYQCAGYEWLSFLREFKLGGCLADDMGLGKTVQTIALLLGEKERSTKNTLSCLIVAPTSVLFNWEREISKFAPSLLVAVYYGSKRKRSVSSLQYADVIITTYGTLLRDKDIFYSLRWYYVILDEAQNIKNPSSHISKVVCSLKAENRLALSGTPIENNLRELWSLFSFVNPGMLGSLAGFMRNIAQPIQQENSVQVRDILRKMVFPFILRRTKKQVAKELPPKTETIIYTEMLPAQQHFYDITKEAYLGRIINSVDSDGIERCGLKIIEGLLRLRQVCCHPAIVDPNYKSDSGKFAAIDEYMDIIVKEKHRVLVFSQFTSVLELLRIRLEKQNISYTLLTGKTTNRSAVVDRFQNDETIPVFLISLKAGGVGLNLTAADYVLHIDPWWNPAVELQATDRAYRIGQEKHVFVYKFITSNSIEEKVLRMQERKKQLVDSLIHAESSFVKNLTRDDVLSLFS